MSEFFRALDQLRYFFHKADVQGEPRITLTFDNVRDKAYFMQELMRDWPISAPPLKSPYSVDEFVYYGLRVRVI